MHIRFKLHFQVNLNYFDLYQITSYFMDNQLLLIYPSFKRAEIGSTYLIDFPNEFQNM